MHPLNWLRDFFEKNNVIKKLFTGNREKDYKKYNKKIQMAIDTIPNPVIYKDYKGVYKCINTAYMDYMGFTREEVIGKKIYDILPKDLADVHSKIDEEVSKTKKKKIYESKLRHLDGTLHQVLFTKGPILDDQGHVMGIIGVLVDITERINAENKIKKLLKLQERMIEVNHAIIESANIEELLRLILDKIIGCMENAHGGSILTLDQKDNLKIIVSKGYDEGSKDFSIPLKESCQWYESKGVWDKIICIDDIDEKKERKFKFIDVKEKMKSFMSAPIVIDGKLKGFVNVDSHKKYAFDQTDIELMKYMKNQVELAMSKYKLYETAMYLSKYDTLTNVYNRGYFQEQFNIYQKKAMEDHEYFSVILFDLNGLKFVNDHYGHLSGDILIKEFSSFMKRKFKNLGIFARYGGDEFIALVHEKDMEKIHEKMDESIYYFKNNPILFDDQKVVCSFSYGIASFPQDGKCYDDLIKIADQNMYLYKQKIKEIDSKSIIDKK
ncbi:sensor domain-containing diguanylate cyclase [Inediibacterium massiliense]|uniref:sensor domain-containing diguanylate cyclase n=1 Tax=Inediibacterium massiliense TaxID=1658111 RepID=UPI0006B4D68B|nr:sensor domain-containing diguanylate cyclase [Inediibacterium massiliense]